MQYSFLKSLDIVANSKKLNCCGLWSYILFMLNNWFFYLIRDGSSEFDPLIATICYTHDTSEFFATTGNTGYFGFTSDFSITATGFSAYWVAGPPIVCGGNLNGSSGIIQSPNFPSDYPDFSLCEWTITVDNGTTVYLELLAFDLENCCGCDYIEIRYFVLSLLLMIFAGHLKR